ncbi:hypothetical protein PFISCL1PPCAC_21120 [Pristionchus fissidentatus]|uniref:Uncharacterized protein n=1 Tax=Pristionchus fissidentatus TaxID=1538716 RepID=A0AAV5WEA5_9BILA|nr:hypothetical protein PFISCL1PPCAC_21120 [Pristionchus fissidentatus]
MVVVWFGGGVGKVGRGVVWAGVTVVVGGLLSLLGLSVLLRRGAAHFLVQDRLVQTGADPSEDGDENDGGDDEDGVVERLSVRRLSSELDHFDGYTRA